MPQFLETRWHSIEKTHLVKAVCRLVEYAEDASDDDRRRRRGSA